MYDRPHALGLRALNKVPPARVVILKSNTPVITALTGELRSQKTMKPEYKHSNTRVD